MIGTSISHFKITAKLGEGGMGEVFRATDTKLGREVAIKVLPELFTSDPDRLARFEREAKAIAALDHPNIVTIHSTEEIDGVRFLVMQLVEGDNLADRIPATGFSLARFLELSIPLLDAVRAAHEKGITHRDLKPTNIMVGSDGRVRVLDFGLARLSPGDMTDQDATHAATEMMTEAGRVLGTAAYMSPEQAAGGSLDHRSDIFSLGILFYEMVTGRRPFGGDTSAEVITSIMRDTPPPVTESHPALPTRLAETIERALAKNPDDRPSTTTELKAEIEALREDAVAGHGESSTPSDRRPLIAVLPFTNMSPDPDNEYFSDGLTEEIIADLSKIRAVRVISRTSIMQLKGSEKDLRTIGRQLNVRYLLEGSVRKAGNSLRITAQLIDAEEDVHLWAEKYNGTLDDVFDIQERVSRKIVDSLEIELTPADDRQIAERPIDDIRAFEYYLRAKHEIFTFTEEGLDRAADLLLRAMEVVGENALLYSALGMAYAQRINSGVRPDEYEQYLLQAEECASKVFELGPESAEGHHLRGLIWVTRGELQEMADAFKQALVLDPDQASALVFRSVALALAGREATVELERLLRVDPLFPFNQIAPAWAHLMQGRFSQALDVCRHWLEIDADNPLAALLLGEVLARIGRENEAITVLGQLAQRQPETTFGQVARFLVHALRRERDEALEAVTPTLTEAARWDFQFSWDMATGYALIDEKGEALEWLENAMRRGLVNYPLLSRLDPLLENLREEEGFLRLMEETRARWERFEV